MALALFDIDGTMTRGSASFDSSMEKAILETYKTRIPIDLNNFHGYTDRLLLKTVLERDNIPYTPKSLDQCLALFGEIFPIVPGDVTVIPGVLETIPGLARSNLLGLVTGNVEPMARKKLRKFSVDGQTLNDYFPFGGFGSDPHEKRADLIKLAITRAGRALMSYGWSNNNRTRSYGWCSINDIIYVVDDTRRGVQAALEAGVTPIGITTGIYSEEELRAAGAKLIAHSYRDIPGLIQ
jgi:phosphoglycolate phosphatase-like HAD superfamily hydrolase